MRLNAKLLLLQAILGSASAQRTTASTTESVKGATTSVWFVPAGPLTSLPPMMTATVRGHSIATTYYMTQPGQVPFNQRGYLRDWWDDVRVIDMLADDTPTNQRIAYEIGYAGASSHNGELMATQQFGMKATCFLDTARSSATCTGAWSSTHSSKDDSITTTATTSGTFTPGSIRATQVPVVIVEGTIPQGPISTRPTAGAGLPRATQNAALAGGAAVLAGGALLLA
ncbi:hypothetical protein RB601_008624 [Gaeumannomyces tritici]